MTHVKKKVEEKEATKMEATQEATELEEKAVLEAERVGKVREEEGFSEQQRQLWKPVSRLGGQVKEGSITDIDVILDQGFPIFEVEIVDALVPNLANDLLMVGQAKGKFGGGQRRAFAQTQKKTQEGNKPSFTTVAIVGNNDGYVGVGFGKSKETVPAREKAIRNAKLNLIRIRRGCGSWQCGCATPHSIPYAVRGRCGSVVVTLMPAPKGKGLIVEKELQKILRVAGIKDIWSEAVGQTRSKSNLIRACIVALKNLSNVKVGPSQAASLGLCEGRMIKSVGEQ